MRLYVGIDVSKDKLDVACVDCTASPLSHSIFNNNKDGFKKLHLWTEKLKKKVEAEDIHYCMEATGIYSESVSQFLSEQENCITSVENPAQVKAFAQSRLIRTKTDKVDAEILANYCLTNKPAALQFPDEGIGKLKKLQRHLEHLITNRAHERIYLESCVDKDIKLLTNQNILFLTEQIKELENQINDHIDKHPFLKEKVDLIKSIPNLGNKSAWIILSELQVTKDSKINIKSQTAHAGLAPMEHQSGKSVNKKAKICKTGNHRLRRCLYMPALSTINSKSAFGDFYRHLVSNGKEKKVAIVAVMRKLLTVALGVLNNGTPYDPECVQKKQAAFSQKKLTFP